MFDLVKVIILGAVEGLTEFLPVSSTGHLILVNQWLNFSGDFNFIFDIVIQLGAILAVVVYFWPRLWPWSQANQGGKEIWTLWSKILFAVVPVVILGALLGGVVKEKLFNPWIVALALIIGGLILIYIENRRPSARIQAVGEISFKLAFIIGVIQCLALIPGVSRSAATIIGALVLGVARPAAAEFSFFLAIPTMVAASGYSLLKYHATLSMSELVTLTLGFIISFLTAWLAIRFFIKFIERHDFKSFGYYRIILGIIVILFFLLK